MKTIVGYVRSIPGGAGLSGVPVSIRLLKDNTLVPVGGMAQASVNPISTDANGRFEWSCELSPGPIKVEAAIDAGAELKVRVGEEVMQAGDIYISDITTMGQMFTNGVIDDVDNELSVAAVTGSLQVTVATGAANFNGRIFQTHTTRTLNIDPNPTLANRIDVIYAEHIRTGVDAGKQTIGIVKGTVSGVAPAVPQPADTVRISLANVTIPQGATSVTVVNNATLATPTNVTLESGSVKLTTLATEVRDKLTDKMFTITSPTTGQHLAYNGSKWINENNVISAAEDVAVASPTTGQVLTYSGGKWKNLSLPAPPAPPTVSIAAATDSVITSPSNGQFLVYSSSRWRNATLDIDIPSSKFAQSAFSDYGYLGNNVLLASCSVTVPAGTWVLKAEAHGEIRGSDPGGGMNNIWFQGNALSGLDASHTVAVVRTDQGVERGWSHSAGRVVTVASSTTFTLDLWAAKTSSGYATAYLYGGKLMLSAV